MADYTVSTQSARQDAALVYVARKEGQSVQQYLNDVFADVVRRALGQFAEQKPAELAAAYRDATPAVRAQVDALLGLG